jgi:hypothetical protein
MKKKKKPKTTRPGTVEKIIKSPFPQEPEKAEIAVEGADHLYREIRIENTLEDEKGNQVKLKEGHCGSRIVGHDPQTRQGLKRIGIAGGNRWQKYVIIGLAAKLHYR